MLTVLLWFQHDKLLLKAAPVVLKILEDKDAKQGLVRLSMTTSVMLFTTV